MRLPKPSAPFSPVCVVGESITVDTAGKVLVLPTGSDVLLPSFNEYVLNSNRLTLAESPFGGMKGSGSPDYAPGTLFCQTDGVYLTDTSGTNSTKTLTAGKLKELNLMSVDTTGHTITEEFQIINTSLSNNPTVIDNCDSAPDGWTLNTGTGLTFSADTTDKQDGTASLKVDGTTHATGGTLTAGKAVSLNLSNAPFISFWIKSSINNANAYFALFDGTNRAVWTDVRFILPANTWKRIVLPVQAPQGETGLNPTVVNTGFNRATITLITVGIANAGNDTIATFWVDDIKADVAKPCYLELQHPDNLADSSITLQAWDGSAYQTTGVYKLDSSYSAVSTTSANWKLADGTKFDDCYGSGNGRALFPKGASAETKAGSSGSITYSANKGTSKRIGFRVDLPPSDGGRTNFNKIRLKTILTYAPDAEDNYSASYDFADSTNTSYGLQNLSKPWVALYDPASSLIDFYLFTHRPKNLSFKRNDDGTIHEVTLYPGNGLIYHGQITYANLTADSNSDGIPDCLEASVEGSLTKFLQAYGMVI